MNFVLFEALPKVFVARSVHVFHVDRAACVRRDNRLCTIDTCAYGKGMSCLVKDCPHDCILVKKTQQNTNGEWSGAFAEKK